MGEAFDSLCHSLNVKKLEAYGFGHNSLNLPRSYFDNRLNRIKIGDVTSDWKKMVLGCPQGSSFDPLLWNLFQKVIYPFKLKTLTLACIAYEQASKWGIGRKEK